MQLELRLVSNKSWGLQRNGKTAPSYYNSANTYQVGMGEHGRGTYHTGLEGDDTKDELRVQLEKDKSITSADKKKAQSEGKACEVFLKGEGYAAAGDTKKAKSYFERVTKNYKGTIFAKKAEERIAELE